MSHYARLLKLAAVLWLLMLAMLLLAGCTATAPYVAKGVARYCAEPEPVRKLIRAEVAAQIAPNRISVECAGDVP